MAETKKVVTAPKATQSGGQVKTVNRSGKSLIKKALVVKVKNQSKISAENIKKLNEKLKQEKEAVAKMATESKNKDVESALTKATAVKEDKNII